MADRRSLSFAGIEDIMPEVDRLLAGHETAGNWTLGQILDHLATTVNLSLDPPAADATPTREQALARRLFFRAPSFPEGQAVPPVVGEPAPGIDPSRAGEELRAALRRLAAHEEGAFAPHPVLGPLTRADWLRFHARHAAHHLSFVAPC